MSGWEDLYDEAQRLRSENDALRLRISVLEKAVEEARKEKHDANNRCQAVVNVCETAIASLRTCRLPLAAADIAADLENAIAGRPRG